MLIIRRLSMLGFRHSWVSFFDAFFFFFGREGAIHEPLHACAGWVVPSFHYVSQGSNSSH